MNPAITSLLLLHALLPPSSFALRQQWPIVLAGVLQVEPQGQCTALSVDHESAWYLLDDYGPFGIGDTVTVVCTTATTSLCGGRDFGFLPDNSIGAWKGFEFGCGTLRVDSEYGCEVMFSNVYGPISIAGHTGFGAGDVIRLRADLFLQMCAPLPECSGSYCVTSPLAGLLSATGEEGHLGSYQGYIPIGSGAKRANNGPAGRGYAAATARGVRWVVSREGAQ